MHIVSLIYVGTAVIILALSVPLILGRVAPNSLYGLRIPATFADERVWYEANRRHGYDLLALAILLIASSLLMPLLGLSERAFGLSLSAIAVLGTLTVLVVGWRRANRLLAETGSGG